MKIRKIDNDTIEMTDDAPVSIIKIFELRQKLSMLLLKKAELQLLIDEVKAQIFEAKNLGVE